MNNLQAIMMIYAFSDMRPHAATLLEIIELIAKKANIKRPLVKYRIENERGSGLRVLTPDLLKNLYTKAKEGKLWELSMKSESKNPQVKIFTHLAYGFAPAHISIHFTGGSLNNLTADDLMDIGGLLFDSFNAIYGCVMVGPNNLSLFEVALGMQSNIQTPEEIKKTLVWANNERYAAEYMRDIYWINFIRKSIKTPYDELEELYKKGEITSYKLLKTGAAFAIAKDFTDFQTNETKERIEWLKKHWDKNMMPKEELPFKENPEEIKY